jgi:hypothetical protein
MSIYMLNKIRTGPEILASKVDPSAARENEHFLQKFWLWKPAPKMCRVTRSFMFWFFLSYTVKTEIENYSKFILKKSHFLYILIFIWKYIKFHTNYTNILIFVQNLLILVYFHMKINMYKKCDFFSTKSTNFQLIFFTV